VAIFSIVSLFELALVHGTRSFAPELGALVALVGIGWLAGSAIGRMA